MRKILLGVCMLISLAFYPALTQAAPPVVVTHAVDGVTTRGSEFVMEVAVRVVNPGETRISNLSLALVSMPPFLARKTTLTVGDLDPHQSANLTVEMVTRGSLDLRAFSRATLFWAATAVDAGGARVEFPVTSRWGGKR